MLSIEGWMLFIQVLNNRTRNSAKVYFYNFSSKLGAHLIRRM
jgi:hypothetical protein